MSLPFAVSRTAFRPLSLLPRSCAPRRAVHHMPIIGGKDAELAANGIPGLFSKKAFNTSWTRYQQHLIDNLNRLTAGTDFALLSPINIAVQTARQSDLAATFNYASQAHNNHFFFEGLAKDGKTVDIPFQVMQLIPYSFSSVEELKAEMLAVANAMFGSGWVWLVMDKNRHIGILCTYNAGTPYGNGHRLQDADMNTRPRYMDTAKELSAATKQAMERSNVRSWATPLLNIKVFEHAWVEDYGVDGKQEYLEAVWNAIDWNEVHKRCPSSGNNQPERIQNFGGQSR